MSTHVPPWVTAVVLPVLTLIGGVLVARITARGTQRVTELEREIPPYDALANRVTSLETRLAHIEEELSEERRNLREAARYIDRLGDWIRHGAPGDIPLMPNSLFPHVDWALWQILLRNYPLEGDPP